MAIFAIFGKQGVNMACGAQNLQLRHHFSKTRHHSGQSDTYLNSFVHQRCSTDEKVMALLRPNTLKCFEIFGILSTLKCSHVPQVP